MLSQRLLKHSFGLILLALASTAQGAPAAQIDAAIDKAKAFLYSMQRDGLWEGDPVNQENQGGQTAIATYALLASGESSQSPKLTKAIEFLKNLKSENVYVLGVRAQIWSFLGEGRDIHKLVDADAQALIGLLKAQEPARGMYHYPKTPPNTYDHSISQYGVLGLWALQEDGAEIGSRVWDAMDAAWRAHQSHSGSWAYIVNGQDQEGENTLSMTCAGVATLFITHNYVHAAEARGCNGNVRDENIERGLAWAGKNFSRATGKDGSRDANVRYYLFYGIERIGVAAGFKYLGDTNWFEAGSDYILGHQNADGSWGDPGQLFGQNARNIPSTAFGILFLTHGSAPIVMNKLSYPSALPNKKPAEDAWNERPRDVYNITHWMGRQAETVVKWHIVDIDSPLADLLDAPTTLMAGAEPMALNPTQEAKLRDYVDRGGMLIANADCGNKRFSQSFQATLKKLYPKYTFRDLPPGHLIFTNQQYHADKWANKPRLLGLSNGVRELAVLIPEQDPSRVWQVPFQGAIAPYAIGADLIQYSMERAGLRERRPEFFVQPDPKAASNRSLRVARISYAGNSDPEPGGWPRIAAIVHNQDHLDLQIDTVALGKGALSPATDRLAALTGTEQKRFEPNEWRELVDYVHNGGTLLIDAAGGSNEFGAALEAGLAASFGPEAASLHDPLPETDPVFKNLGNSGLYTVYSRKVLGNLHAPRLRGMKVGNRTALYFSREDLTHGLLGTDVDGVIGYKPAVATSLVRAITLSVAPPAK